MNEVDEMQTRRRSPTWHTLDDQRCTADGLLQPNSQMLSVSRGPTVSDGRKATRRWQYEHAPILPSCFRESGYLWRSDPFQRPNYSERGDTSQPGKLGRFSYGLEPQNSLSRWHALHRDVLQPCWEFCRGQSTDRPENNSADSYKWYRDHYFEPSIAADRHGHYTIDYVARGDPVISLEGPGGNRRTYKEQLQAKRQRSFSHKRGGNPCLTDGLVRTCGPLFLDGGYL